MLSFRLVVLACVAGCGVRAPAVIDVDTLLAAQGPLEARRTLEIRVIGDPRDVAGRLALAALAEKIGRPSEAIEALEQVVALGGPLGARWHDEDRARLARLIAARGRVRLARGAARARADLARARQLGAIVRDDELRRADFAIAIAALRHSDGKTRAAGRQTVAASPLFATFAGAGDSAGPDDSRGRFGAWLWQQGARRAAWDELSAWHAAAVPPRDLALQSAYLVAARWWIPLDLPMPDASELVGSARCAFVCAARDAAGDPVAERGFLQQPASPVREPADVAAVVAITLRQALRGEASWTTALAVRVDAAAFTDPAARGALPRHVQPIIARLTGHTAAVPAYGATAEERLVIAAERVLAGAPVEDLAALLAGAPEGDAGAVRQIAAPRAPFAGDLAAARAEAAACHAGALIPELERAAAQAAITRSEPVEPAQAQMAELRAIAVAYARDPLIADRLGRDAVAGTTDAAAMHAALGALFDALGDPARARAAWQAAVNATDEPAFLGGLAEAQARQGDGDAALIHATRAAAASGDPAAVWARIAHALVGAGVPVHALEAARDAIDLASPETLPSALDAAITASRALDRTEQAAQLTAQRERIAGAAPAIDDPTDAPFALALARREPGARALARLWVAARWNPRSVELRAELIAALPLDDARRAVVIGELVELAGDRDPDVRRAAVAALR